MTNIMLHQTAMSTVRFIVCIAMTWKYVRIAAKYIKRMKTRLVMWRRSITSVRKSVQKTTD